MNTQQPPQNNYPAYPPQQGGYPPAQQQPGGGSGYPPQYGGYPPYYQPQPPKKGPNVVAIIAGVVALVAIAALVVILAVPSVRASIFPPEATATLQPTYTPLPTYTPQPTKPLPTAVPTLAPLPTQTQPVVGPDLDYSSVTLKPGVLPVGFELLTEDEAEAMGLDVSAFATSIAAFTDAPIQAVTVGLNSSPDAFQVVVVVVAAPLTSSEQSMFDLEISDPERAADEFAVGMGGGASAWILDDGDTIGDTSIGMGLTMSASGVSMGGEVVIARRGEALSMVIYLYLEGAQQQVTALNLADIIDGQIMQVQGK